MLTTKMKMLKGVFFVLALIATANCNPQIAATESAGVNPGAHLCDNPLYPVRQGAAWTYSSTGIAGATDPYRFTDTITAIRPDGFTLTSQFTGLARTQEWSCKPEGLVALQLGSGPAGGVSTNQVQMNVITSNIAGVTIPSAVAAGQAWTYSLDFAGSAAMEGVTGEVRGNASSVFNALATESVTVPAGTFDAMKVLVTTNMDMQATVQGFSQPIDFTATSTVWFAPGVGWVKMENAGDWQGNQYTETIHLESYSIPQ
jgi:hypothetical protein